MRWLNIPRSIRPSLTRKMLALALVIRFGGWETSLKRINVSKTYKTQVKQWVGSTSEARPFFFFTEIQVTVKYLPCNCLGGAYLPNWIAIRENDWRDEYIACSRDFHWSSSSKSWEEKNENEVKRGHHVDYKAKSRENWTSATAVNGRVVENLLDRNWVIYIFLQ